MLTSPDGFNPLLSPTDNTKCDKKLFRLLRQETMIGYRPTSQSEKVCTMKRLSVGLILCLLVSAVVRADEPAPKKGEKASPLEGSWKVVQLEFNGEKVPAGAPGTPSRFVFTGKKVSLFTGGKVIPHMKDLGVSLKPGKETRGLDLIRGKDELLPCLVKISGEQLTFAMPMVPTDPEPGFKLSRPKSFDTAKEQIVVLTAKRITGE